MKEFVASSFKEEREREERYQFKNNNLNQSHSTRHLRLLPLLHRSLCPGQPKSGPHPKVGRNTLLVCSSTHLHKYSRIHTHI